MSEEQTIVPKKCPNCGTWMAEDQGEYCPGCGQKYTTGRVTVRELLQDAFEAIFNFESKAYQTFFQLFIPGKLTQEYLKGRQKSYISPLRLFLLTAIFHFAVLAYLADYHARPALQQITRQQNKEAYRSGFVVELDSVLTKTQSQDFSEDSQVEAAFDSVRQAMDVYRKDSVNLPLLSFSGTESSTIKVSSEDLFTLPASEILDKYHLEGFFDRVSFRQTIRLVTNAENTVGFFLGKLTWMVLLMMPALALILKLLYIRRRRYYVEHLIFSFHYHAYAFLLISLTALIDHWAGTYGILSGLAFVSVLLYALMAMRRVYQQGALKTLVKFLILHNIYGILFLFFLVFALIITAFFY